MILNILAMIWSIPVGRFELYFQVVKLIYTNSFCNVPRGRLGTALIAGSRWNC